MVQSTLQVARKSSGSRFSYANVRCEPRHDSNWPAPSRTSSANPVNQEDLKGHKKTHRACRTCSSSAMALGVTGLLLSYLHILSDDGSQILLRSCENAKCQVQCVSGAWGPCICPCGHADMCRTSSHRASGGGAATIFCTLPGTQVLADGSGHSRSRTGHERGGIRRE